MKQLEKLIERIIARVNVNLREPAFDVGPYVREITPFDKFLKFYGFYGLTPLHPLHFHFRNSNLAGSYFLGKCFVDYSILYKSDIRGDELKARGDIFKFEGLEIPLHDDEVIRIKDSYLIKNSGAQPQPRSGESRRIHHSKHHFHAVRQYSRLPGGRKLYRTFQHGGPHHYP